MGTVIMPRMVPDLVAPVGDTPIGSQAVGSIVKMNVGGTPYEWIVVNQGKPSSLYDKSCNGTWLLMKDIYENRQWNSTDYNDYEKSTINSYLNSSFFNLLDANIRSVVKRVRIPYRPGAGENRTPINSGASGLASKVFLLSPHEVGFTASDTGGSAPEDGARLAYFNNGAGYDIKRVAYWRGTSSSWWLRSPLCNSGRDSVLAINVYQTGDWNFSYCSYSFGVRPALILPSNAKVDGMGNVIGG